MLSSNVRRFAECEPPRGAKVRNHPHISRGYPSPSMAAPVLPSEFAHSIEKCEVEESRCHHCPMFSTLAAGRRLLEGVDWWFTEEARHPRLSPPQNRCGLPACAALVTAPAEQALQPLRMGNEAHRPNGRWTRCRFGNSREDRDGAARRAGCLQYRF